MRVNAMSYVAGRVARLGMYVGGSEDGHFDEWRSGRAAPGRAFRKTDKTREDRHAC
jgi:hypothetical protein